MRLLLLGGTGQVGREFLSLDLPKDVEVVAPVRRDLDLTDAPAIAEIIAAGPWNVVVNAAGYTNVDRAESEQAAAFAVNADAPSRLAVETERHGIPLIHISTDYVFDGRKNAPYIETDETAPLNVYGHSKLAGERAVCASNPRHVILRTSWVYSPYGHNFVKTILRLADERESPHHRRGPAWLPHCRPRYRNGMSRHCPPVRVEAGKRALWHLPFCRRRRDELVRICQNHYRNGINSPGPGAADCADPDDRLSDTGRPAFRYQAGLFGN